MAECSPLKPSSILGSVEACQGKLAFRHGLKIVFPDIFVTQQAQAVSIYRTARGSATRAWCCRLLILHLGGSQHALCAAGVGVRCRSHTDVCNIPNTFYYRTIAHSSVRKRGVLLRDDRSRVRKKADSHNNTAACSPATRARG